MDVLRPGASHTLMPQTRQGIALAIQALEDCFGEVAYAPDSRMWVAGPY